MGVTILPVFCDAHGIIFIDYIDLGLFSRFYKLFADLKKFSPEYTKSLRWLQHSGLLPIFSIFFYTACFRILEFLKKYSVIFSLAHSSNLPRIDMPYVMFYVIHINFS